jgi:hypothetical protein
VSSSALSAVRCFSSRWPLLHNTFWMLDFDRLLLLQSVGGRIYVVVLPYGSAAVNPHALLCGGDIELGGFQKLRSKPTSGFHPKVRPR